MNYAARAVDGMKSSFYKLNPAIKDFSKRIPVNFTRGHFTVKTVESKREFWQVMALRYEVFHREYMNKKIPFGIDRDRFDMNADHLAIVDNRINKIVGTYRLITDLISDNFYSKTEFCIDSFLNEPGKKVELSRACIHKEYRNGVVINMLWRGIVEYLSATGARWLFGLGSIKSLCPTEVSKVYAFFENAGAIDNKHGIEPLSSLKMKGFTTLHSDLSADTQDLVPPLLKSYIRAGATIAGEPAVDLDFKCTDFFVILDTHQLSGAYNRKYQVN
jgi:putative hemolysin